jgi:hypothetical protein
MYWKLAIRSLSTVALICAVGCGQRATPVISALSDPCFQHLPTGWTIERSTVLDAGQVAGIAAKLGVTGIRQISNTNLLIEGKHIQLNILEAENAGGATQLHAAIARTKGDPAFCVLIGSKVYEYVGDASITADFVKSVSAQLGI